MSDHIHEVLKAAASKGDQIRGGCDQCSAFQTLDEDEAGIYVLTVHHDDDCPVWLVMKAEAN